MSADPLDFVPYEQPSPWEPAVPAKRIVEWTRSYWRKDAGAGALDITADAAGAPARALTNRLPLGQIERLGLPYETYMAAFTDTLLEDIYGADAAGGPPRVSAEALSRAGYQREADRPSYWWIPSARGALRRARPGRGDSAGGRK